MISRITSFPLCALLTFAGVASSAADDRPNIIVILADDMGYADAGFTGSNDIETPHLDQLAMSGVIFSQGYCNHPFCAPSRAALLTGRYQQRFGFEDNPAYDPSNPHLGIDPGEVLLPQRLKQVGYTTGAIGKWHLGAAAPFHPNNRGFDYFYGFLGGGHDYYTIDGRKPVHSAYFQPLVRNEGPATFDGYLTTAFSEDAARFVGDNKDQPFFLYLSYNAPHAPLQAPEATIAKYAHLPEGKRRIYAAMVDEMDQGIGMVIQALEQHGLRNNTLVFFLSDNGGPQAMSWNKEFGNGSSNAPFRGGKVNLYEGGIHVPFIASWPDRISSGKCYHKPVIALDIARTAVELAGADATAKPVLEGVNLIPYVTGHEGGAPHDNIFWRDEDGKRWAVLASNGHKYVKDLIGGTPELFYLPEDASETSSMAAEHPELSSELRDRWDEWNRDNIAGKIGNYLEYFDLREQFYLDVIPAKAKQVRHPDASRR